MANLLGISSLVFGVIAFILIFASWMVSRKDTPSDSDLKNSKNLQLAALIFLFLSLLLGLLAPRYPTLGAAYVARAQAALPSFTTTTRV